MGGAGAIFAVAILCGPSAQVAFAADSGGDALSTSWRLAVADVATGLSAADHGATLVLRLAR